MKQQNATNPERPVGLALVMQAALFAATKHRGQRRKGEPIEDDVFQDRKRTPYINHPLEVAARIASAEPNIEPEVVAAALLHDVSEDCRVQREMLADEFGEDVAETVAWVSELPKSKYKYAERKAEMMARVPKFPRSARLVKVADMTTNLNDLLRNTPKEWGLEKQQGQFDRARAIFECIKGESAALDAAFEEVMKQRPQEDLRNLAPPARGARRSKPNKEIGNE